MHNVSYFNGIWTNLHTFWFCFKKCNYFRAKHIWLWWLQRIPLFWPSQKDWWHFGSSGICLFICSFWFNIKSLIIPWTYAQLQYPGSRIPVFPNWLVGLTRSSNLPVHPPITGQSGSLARMNSPIRMALDNWFLVTIATGTQTQPCSQFSSQVFSKQIIPTNLPKFTLFSITDWV